MKTGLPIHCLALITILTQDQNARLVHLPVEGRLPSQHWGEGEEEGLKGVRHGQEGEDLY